jgi:hypothetical protein
MTAARSRIAGPVTTSFRPSLEVFFQSFEAAEKPVGARSNQNIENNPMQSKNPGPPAWLPRPIPRKHFDTSGKSAAQLHHPAICKRAHAPSNDGPFGVIDRRKTPDH